MRHRKLSVRLGRQTAHRKALFKNMTIALFAYGKIKTTEAKAKQVARIASKMITLAMKGDLHSRRQIVAFLNDKEIIKRLYEVIAHQYQSRQPTEPGGRGGYTRIVKLGPRRGDCAPMALLELV